MRVDESSVIVHGYYATGGERRYREHITLMDELDMGLRTPH